MEGLDKAIEKLRAGEELLRTGGSVPASQVLEVISDAIRALESCKETAPAAAVKPEVSSENGGSEGSSPPKRRGGGKGSGQKRAAGRRRSHPYSSCKEITSDTLDDGFSWRKYGQKNIQSSKYPRNYYRCTHKHSKMCPAARQTQTMEDDPSMHRITYIGDHTCISPSKQTHESDAPAVMAAASSETCVISETTSKEEEEEGEVGRLNALTLASSPGAVTQEGMGPWAVEGGDATPSSHGQSPLSSSGTDLDFYFELEWLPFFDEQQFMLHGF